MTDIDKPQLEAASPEDDKDELYSEPTVLKRLRSARRGEACAIASFGAAATLFFVCLLVLSALFVVHLADRTLRPRSV
ncbi:unnamed protein product [Hermetia illucens]|uniref:Uncharacterized protein n=1 Tax=Hermetia illucens TaxID=343691 RepID=A0A7R8U9X2_HERIL|nr:unnamed protein product [Hermetia illucens]